MTVTVITIPQPTANGPLHVGHLSGPYIAADVAARAARARGERVLALTGLDIHQNWVLAGAEKGGIDVHAMIRRYRDEIAETFRLARIGYDAFLDPQESGYQRAVTSMLAELIERGRLRVRPYPLMVCAGCDRTLHHAYVVGACPRCGGVATGGACEACGSFTNAQNLVGPVCNRCGGRPVTRTANLPVLPMEEYRAALTRLWLTATLPGRVRDMLAYYLATGLPEIPLAYPTDWGLDAGRGLRICVYTEVGLSYLYGVARALDPAADGLDAWLASWREVGGVWHFHGIDNAFYFAIFWPALYAAIGVDPAPLRGLVVNEFYTLSGLKFSTSRNHAIWANEFLADEDPGIVRLYLAWDRPDRYASDFTVSSYRDFACRVAPLLAGSHRPDGTGPATRLAPLEVRRGIRALCLDGFDPALAARCLIAALDAGHDGGPLREVLTGGPATDAQAHPTPAAG